MSIKVIIGILLAVAAAGVAGYFLFMNGGSAGSLDTEGDTTEESGTFASLMAMGQNLSCTFTYDDGTNVSSGTVYLAAGAERIRGDFNYTDSAAGPMEAHLIRDGGYNYLWGSSLPQGIKTAVTAENSGSLFGDNDNAPIDENTEYQCMPWTVDESKFAAPTDVSFQDMSMFMGGTGTTNVDAGGTGAPNMQCVACAKLSDPNAIQECLAQYSCI